MTEWIDLRHPETEGTTRAPDDPGVIAWHEARGWERYDPEPASPAVPAGPQIDPAEVGAEWVELVHPETEARHQFPNNRDALQGAVDAGWVEPNKDGSIPKRAKRAAEKAQSTAADATPATEQSTDRPADRAATDTKE